MTSDYMAAPSQFLDLASIKEPWGANTACCHEEVRFPSELVQYVRGVEQRADASVVDGQQERAAA
jgi:hypothetical protein